MATKELLNKLDFRRFQLSGLDKTLSSIIVRYGHDISGSPGHVSAKKFAKNYLPVILYSNPNITVTIDKFDNTEADNADAKDKKPEVVIQKADGSIEVFDTAALSKDFPKSVDKEIFKRLTGLDVSISLANGKIAYSGNEPSSNVRMS